jgi:hypothetical protein
MPNRKFYERDLVLQDGVRRPENTPALAPFRSVLSADKQSSLLISYEDFPDGAAELSSEALDSWASANGVSRAALEAAGVPGVGGGVGLDWFSDWRTNDLWDEGKWTGNLCTMSDIPAVVAATGLTFPIGMDYVYRYEYVNVGMGCFMLVTENLWPETPIGSYYFNRWYWRFDFGEGQNFGTAHPFHHGGGGSPYDGWFNTGGTATATRIGSMTRTFSNNEYPRIRFGFWDDDDASPLTNHTYRFEQRIHRISEELGKVAIRAFNPDGSPVREGNDPFRQEDNTHNGINDVEASLGPSDGLQQMQAPANFLRRLEIGNNDPNITFSGGPHYAYVGGVAVRISEDPDAWIGPYPVGPEAD